MTSQAVKDGPGNVLKNVISCLDNPIYKHYVISIHGPNELFNDMDKNVDMTLNLNHKRLLDDIKKIFLTKKIFDSINPDIVQAHLIRASLFCRIYSFFSKPYVIITYHNMEKYMTSSSIKAKILRFLEKKLDNKKCIYVAVSNEIEEFLIKEYNYSKDRVFHIRNAVKFKEYLEDNSKRKIRKIVFYGRLHQQKGIDHIIKSVANIANYMRDNRIIFEIYGDGPEKQYLARIISESNINDIVFIKGKRDRFWETDEWKQGIFVMSSIHEGMPMAMLEAIHHRMPIVTNLVGDIHHLLNEENSFIHNVDNLSEKIMLVFENQELAIEKSEKAYASMLDSFSIELMCKSYNNLYRRFTK